MFFSSALDLQMGADTISNQNKFIFDIVLSSKLALSRFLSGSSIFGGWDCLT